MFPFSVLLRILSTIVSSFLLFAYGLPQTFFFIHITNVGKHWIRSIRLCTASFFSNGFAVLAPPPTALGLVAEVGRRNSCGTHSYEAGLLLSFATKQHFISPGVVMKQPTCFSSLSHYKKTKQCVSCLCIVMPNLQLFPRLS